MVSKFIQSRTKNVLFFKKVDERAIIPAYQTPKSSGFDFHAIEDTVIGFNKTRLVRTGLVVVLPENTEMQIRPRSGLSLKTGLIIPNSPGTIDEDYRGEISIIMKNTSLNPEIIKAGDRIAQGIICDVRRPIIVCTDQVNETSRGTGGFGHTGTNESQIKLCA